MSVLCCTVLLGLSLLPLLLAVILQLHRLCVVVCLAVCGPLLLSAVSVCPLLPFRLVLLSLLLRPVVSFLPRLLSRVVLAQQYIANVGEAVRRSGGGVERLDDCEQCGQVLDGLG